jgi:hypothetical protein
MTRSGIFQFIAFFLYVLVQVLLLKNLVLFKVSFCFFYVAFILLIPIEINALLLMLAGFLTGFSIDIFYDSLGMHAFALVVVGYIRNYWLATITPQGGYDGGDAPSVSSYGLQWFLVYTLPLIFVHHFVLFFVEASGFDMFWYTMLKVMSSVVFTLTVILIVQYLSPDKRRS